MCIYIYTITYVGTLPDMTCIYNISTIVGHRFGHQSGVDDSSGRNSITILHGIAFHIYLMFSKIGNIRQYNTVLYYTVINNNTL